MPAPHTHRLEVELELEPGLLREVDLAMPAWSPGSYLVRDYARHVEGVTAWAGTRQLAVRKLDKQTWRVDAEGTAPTPIRVRYHVYAYELTVRTSHHDDRHAFVQGPSVFMYVRGRENEPCTVHVEAPAGWRIATALPPAAAPTESGARTFVARDYDELADSPIEAGIHEALAFQALGRPHSIAVVDAAHVDFDRDALVTDLRKVVEETARLFTGETDPLPYNEYTFILHLQPGAHGGLEHRASCTLLSSPFSLPRRGKGWNRRKYEDLLELCAHEYFHTWNIKRIRPEALGPFDYTRESYTRALWAMEGLTAYYDRLLVRRARLVGLEGYLDRMATDLGKLRQTPGRNLQSLEESSFDAWIKLYKPDEHTVNSTVSYYLKGSLVAMALDLDVRIRTEGARSLDHALAALWREARGGGPGFADASFKARIAEAVGLDLSEFFARYVEGREDPPFEELLGRVGIAVEAEEPEDGTAWLGVLCGDQGGAVRVKSTLDGGPAAAGGLYPGDDVVAIDGYRVANESALKDRLGMYRPGEAVRLTLFRREQLREITIPLGPAPAQRFTLSVDEAATPEAAARRTEWLGSATDEGSG
jgi:predicted metalloprotease with PDZ domain